MNATRLGKIFVFVNLTFSLLFAGLALGIATNRIDWSGTGKAVPGEVAQGELAKRKAELRRRSELAGAATEVWQKERAELLKTEKQRVDDQQWYEAQLDILRGKDKKGNEVKAPITALVYDANGLKIDEKTGRPVLQPVADKPLESNEAMQRTLADTKHAIDEELDKIAKLEKQEAELTLEINGEKDKMKGLRDLIAEEERVKQNAAAETETVKPVRVNREVEASLLKKRRLALEARIRELESFAGAATPKP